MTFDEWWKAVNLEAARRGVSTILGDSESHRQGYDEGYNPTEEVDELIDAAHSSI
ncbi:hypothetical protein LCGC14_3150310 [marine sediment metagenome]|uniref:Uncharacterized protein n=1 Tax=marine sediment metagenome TaxID=412755 RepID=A0A0F8VUE6_9ZZZZ